MNNLEVYNKEILRSKHLSCLLKGDICGPLTGYSHIDMPNLKNFDTEVMNYIYNDFDKKVVDNLMDSNINNMDDIAISYFNKNITYKELFNQIDLFSKAFKAYGINKGDRISVCLPNVPEVIYIKYALNKIGATACLIDPRVNPEGILERTNMANAKLLVTIENIYPKIDNIIDQLKVDNILVVSVNSSLDYNLLNLNEFSVKSLFDVKKMKYIIHEKLENNNNKLIDISEFKKLSNKYVGNINEPYDDEVPFSIVYTSGTTGDMKGVMLSNVAYNTSNKQLNVATNNYNRDKTFLGIIPFFSAYGSVAGMNNSLMNGWKVILMPKFNPKKFSKMIYKYKPNVCIYVPKGWQTFIDSTKDLSFLDNPVSGGDIYHVPLQEKTNDSLKESNGPAKISIGYGDSEHSGPVSKTIENDSYKLGSSGIILPGNRIMIIDRETQKPLEYNKEGEICIAGPTMMLEYLNNEKATKDLEIYDEEGRKYFKTGDKGRIDEEGNVFFCERYKRAMMRPDGHTVSAIPIENTILSNDKIGDVVVVGLQKKSKEAGSIITAFVSLKDKKSDFNEVVDEIDNFSFQKLSEREKAMAYINVENIVYNNMGKADYKYYENMHFDDVDAIIKDYTFLTEYKKKRLRIRK